MLLVPRRWRLNVKLFSLSSFAATRDVRRLRAELLVPCRQLVGAGRQVLDGERAVLAGDGEIRMTSTPA